MDKHTYLRTHELTAEHLQIDLGEVGSHLEAGMPASQARTAVTLVKEAGLNVVLARLRAGGSLAEHAASGAATVQVLNGHVRVHVGDESLDVPAGRLVAFDAKVRHGVEAIEDSTLLLTLAEAGS